VSDPLVDDIDVQATLEEAMIIHQENIDRDATAAELDLSARLFFAVAPLATNRVGLA
jgi:hypothetical protein